ncbi:hypothetical protein ACFSBZ_11460 [Amnibacterium flavum]|nr:hypothetical protein [Amnibacterium flavum]
MSAHAALAAALASVGDPAVAVRMTATGDEPADVALLWTLSAVSLLIGVGLLLLGEWRAARRSAAGPPADHPLPVAQSRPEPVHGARCSQSEAFPRRTLKGGLSLDRPAVLLSKR